MMELFQKIPLPVLYVGLGAFFLAPIIAGIMRRSTTVTLMLFLRLAIGWHFLFEGVHKIHLEHVGVTETSKPFNSAVYFENSEGPLAPLMRKAIGDPDEKLIAYTTTDGKAMPPKLQAEWKGILDYFVKRIDDPSEAEKSAVYYETIKARYTLTPEEKAKADALFEKAQEDYVKFLTQPREVKKVGPTGSSTDIVETVPTSVADYSKKVEKLKNFLMLEKPENRTGLGGPDDQSEIGKLQGEVRKARAEIRKEIDEKTKKFKDDLAAIAKAKGWDSASFWDNYDKYEPKHDTLYWMNFATRWGLTAIGIGLLAGLFTRLACLGGALFLLSTYLVDTPFPWLPVSPKSEGNYLFVNKNLVEMLALLVIASTKSGTWMGADALLRNINRWVRLVLVLAAGGLFFWFVVKPAM